MPVLLSGLCFVFVWYLRSKPSTTMSRKYDSSTTTFSPEGVFDRVTRCGSPAPGESSKIGKCETTRICGDVCPMSSFWTRPPRKPHRSCSEPGLRVNATEIPAGVPQGGCTRWSTRWSASATPPPPSGHATPPPPDALPPGDGNRVVAFQRGRKYYSQY